MYSHLYKTINHLGLIEFYIWRSEKTSDLLKIHIESQQKSDNARLTCKLYQYISLTSICKVMKFN